MNIQLLSAGEFLAPNGVFGLPRPLAVTWFPMLIGVVERDDGGVVLIDAGLSAAELDAPLRALGPSGAMFVLRGGSRASAAAQLAARGVAPGRVTHIVATHLHLDHIGAYVDFPNAEIVAPASEYAAARRLGTSGGYPHIEGILRSGRARPVLMGTSPRHGFPGYYDVFADKQVVLLDCRGHTAGSVAVLLSDPASGRSALHAGDAAYAAQEYQHNRVSPFARLTRFKEAWLRESWGHLRAFESAHPETPVVLSHDVSTHPPAWR